MSSVGDEDVPEYDVNANETRSEAVYAAFALRNRVDVLVDPLDGS